MERGRYEPKTMLVIFFGSSGLVLIHAAEKENTVKNIYYIENCLSPALESIKRQRVSSGLRGNKLLHDNPKRVYVFPTRIIALAKFIIQMCFRQVKND